MRLFAAFIVVALATAGGLAAISLASGPPPPSDQAPAGVDTVVAPATVRVDVRMPARRTNATIQRAVQAARRAAFPRAVRAARRDAAAMARAAGLRLAEAIGVSRAVSPYGFWDADTGRFGPGRWCGRVVRRRDGERVSRRECPVPRGLSVRLTVTFATR